VLAITSSGPIGYYGTGSYGTSSYAITSPLVFTGSFAQVQDYLPRGIENHRYAGCKITGPGLLNYQKIVQMEQKWCGGERNERIHHRSL
jgi:hypothetical protein